MTDDMNVLVLGGTGFLGSWIVEEAVARGHRVSVLNRGRSGAVPAGVTALRADRTVGDEVEAALRGTRFDAVIDGSGYAPDPATVGEVASRLPDLASYVFISSVSAYRDWPGTRVADESDPVFTEGEGYGPGKALCERALEDLLPGRVVAIRPGEIVGPRDNGGQLPFLLDRVSRGGRVVAAGGPDDPIAVIDARDLAAFAVSCVEQGVTGPVNATGRLGHVTMGGLLAACQAATGSDAEVIWVPEQVLVAHGVPNFLTLPFFIPLSTMPGGWDIGTDRARALGLASRPVSATVDDTWAWQRDLPEIPLLAGWPRPGLSPDLEREILDAVRVA